MLRKKTAHQSTQRLGHEVEEQGHALMSNHGALLELLLPHHAQPVITEASQKMQSWKTLSREVLLSQPPYLIVENHTVELSDGRIVPEWQWIITPDYVNVVAVTEDGAFLCFRQTKYAVEATTLAPVGGYLDPGEEPLAAAKRELREETGYAASDWRSLGSYAVDGNRGAGRAHLFLAQNAHCIGEIEADDLEQQQLLLLSRAEIAASLERREFKVLASATAVALALRWLDE
jgi:ADP-ribose pyrophosphatase